MMFSEFWHSLHSAKTQIIIIIKICKFSLHWDCTVLKNITVIYLIKINYHKTKEKGLEENHS